LFPVFYFAFAAIVFNLPLKNFGKLLLSPYFWFVCALAFFAGVGLKKMRRWLWVVFLLANFFIIIYNWKLAYNLGAPNHPYLSFWASFVVIFILVYRVRKRVRVPYFLPSIRWWESNPNHRFSLPVVINCRNQGTFSGEVLDLSLQGCFIKSRDDMLLYEPVQVSFVLFKKELSFQGRIVWKTGSSITNPKGVGIKFEALGRREGRRLRWIERRLRRLSWYYFTSIFKGDSEFVKELDALGARPRGVE